MKKGMSLQSTKYHVQGSGKRGYDVTINFDKGHWCTCPGMISKKGTFQAEAGRTRNTSCKHVKKIIDENYRGNWGDEKADGSRTPSPVTARDRDGYKLTGRQAAVLAAKEKLQVNKVKMAQAAGGSLLDRIAKLGEARG